MTVSRLSIFFIMIAIIGGLMNACSSHLSASDRLFQQQASDGYTVLSYSLCKPGEEGFVSEEMWGRMAIPYDTLIESRADSAVVSFSFVDNCMAKFTGLASIKGDTLRLTYGYTPDLYSAASCFCEYRIRFSISNERMSWKYLAIRHENHIYPQKN